MSDAAVLHLTGRAASLRLCGNRLVVKEEDVVRAAYPLRRIGTVLVHGTATVTGPSLTALLREGATVVWLSGSGRRVGTARSPASTAYADQIRQLDASRDEDRRLELAAAIVAAKIHNQRTLLRRRLAVAPENAVGCVELARLARRASRATGLPSLLGTEGAAAAAYYRCLRRLVPSSIGFVRRDRHGADVVNQVTNYAGAVLREHVLTAIDTAGLLPTASLLHQPMLGRPTLAFDLMEEWRAPLVDALVLTMLGRGQLGPTSSEPSPSGPRLTLDARKSVIAGLEQRLDEHVTPYGGTRRRYRDHLHHQVGSLVDWLRGSRPYQPFVWR